MQDIIQLMTSPVQCRQGDVLIIPVSSKIDDCDLGKLVTQDNNRVVLAYGKVTGHAHAFYPDLDLEQSHVQQLPKVRLFELKPNCARKYAEFDINNANTNIRDMALQAESSARLLRLSSPAILRHGRHGGDDFDHYAINLLAHDYIIAYQFEHDYMGELRRVTD